MPIIMVTAKSETQDIVAGLEAGADAYLTKPLGQAALVARIKSMLRLKALYDTVRGQAAELELQAAELGNWNRALENQVLEQMSDLERMGRLKRFMSPQLAEWVVSSGDQELFRRQRRDVTVLCCTLKGFTTFVDTTEPDLVFEVLRGYHEAIGPLITRFDGTLERFGDDGGFLVVFNAPLPCTDPVLCAVDMAISLRLLLDQLRAGWRASRYALDFGIGIAQGLMTLGMVHVAGRVDYALLGSVRQLASRLCHAAQGGQILVSQSVWKVAKESVDAAPAGELSLKGQTSPVPIFAVSTVSSCKG
jgi:class 3 adenylate cyclase